MILRAWRLWLIIAILAVVGGLVYWHDKAVPATSGAGAYQWKFVEWGGDAKPQTQVTLVAQGKSYLIGTYDGTCALEPQDYLQYEKSKVVCWFAGGGHEVGVFEEPGQVVVRVGEVDEGAGGVEGFRGNFVLVKRL
jgi:hypothetical protein